MYANEKNVLGYLPCRISCHTWSDLTKTKTMVGFYGKKKNERSL